MKILALVLVILGCSTESALPVQGDAAGSDTEAPCTEWACHVTCYDAGCTCVDVCTSHNPTVCPGPWPCAPDAGGSK